MGSADPQTVNTYVDELILAGCSELAAGHRQEAHVFWRRAAALRPNDEEIWLALLSVVDTDEDRRTCLENVTALNPQNKIALQQLRALDSLMTLMDGEQLADSKTPRRPRRLRWPLLVLALLYLLKLVVLMAAVMIVIGLGVMFGIMLNLV
jgi:ferric-dicitrate binding protein FerR (iron transport regulator)